MSPVSSIAGHTWCHKEQMEDGFQLENSELPSIL